MESSPKKHHVPSPVLLGESGTSVERNEARALEAPRKASHSCFREKQADETASPTLLSFFVASGREVEEKRNIHEPSPKTKCYNINETQEEK